MAVATLITSVSQAMDTMKALGEQSMFFDVFYHQESRQAPANIIQGRMKARVGGHLEACKECGIEDRRNGSYSRRLLVGVYPGRHAPMDDVGQCSIRLSYGRGSSEGGEMEHPRRRV